MKTSALLLLLVITVTASEKIRVSCIGNSITQGNMGGAYPTYLQQKLGDGYKVENDGISGTTLLKEGDKPYWTYGKLHDVFTFQPDIITIKLGTNDTKPQNWDAHGASFKEDYNALIDTLNTLESSPRIFPVLPVPVFKEAWGINNETINLIIPIIEEIGEERNLTVIDANTPLQDYGYCFSDGVHPNSEGSEVIAEVLFKAIVAATRTVQAYSFQNRMHIPPGHRKINTIFTWPRGSEHLFYGLNGQAFPSCLRRQQSTSQILIMTIGE